MISIRKSTEELDRLVELHAAASECYQLALRSIAQYAIEIDPAETEEFRDNLETIEAQWRKADRAEALRAAQGSLRGELREYRDRTHRRLNRLRREIEAGAKAMAGFAASVTTNGADHEATLRRELGRLDSLAAIDDLGELHHGIHDAVSAIASSLEQIQRKNQMIVVQLQDEIRMLHQEVQAERRALFTDSASGAWTRQKLDRRIEDLLRIPDQPFFLLFVAVRNLKRLEARHSKSIVEGMLKALILRFQTVTGPDALVGRWSEDQFTAVLDLQPSAAIVLSREVTRNLSGSYGVQENGVSHEVNIQIATAVVERGATTDATAFLRKLGQVTAALQS